MTLHYAIGDIHGDFVQLKRILRWIEADLERNAPNDYRIVFIGDLVDRREASREVIEHIMAGLATGEPWVVLKGNHDRMFSQFLSDPSQEDPILRKDLTWLHDRLGGRTTLASYGVDISEEDITKLHNDALNRVPQDHIQFLTDLRVSYETPQCFFAHAGVNPTLPLDAQSEDDLIWIRAPFHDHLGAYEKLIIHGHTPVEVLTHYGNRVNIDTGAAYGGPLSAVAIEGDAIFEICADSRKPLRP